MRAITQLKGVPVRIVSDLGVADLKAALAAGWQDFRSAPAYGLFFGAVYVLGGLLLVWALFTRGQAAWLVPAAAGFPLLAPFAAVGLYEVSRRREAGQALDWRGVLGALYGRGDEQIMSMGVIVFVAFGFWLMVAHGIFAVFVAGSPEGESLAFLMTGAGIAMLIVGGAVGGVMALAFYAVTVISLPMLVDRDVDFMTAIITSLAVVKGNAVTLFGWAAFLALALFAAMVPLFLGLLVVLPVLAHATWHLYRRAVAA